MSWSPEDEDPPRKVRPRGMCDCEMCNEDPAEETELDLEDTE